MSSKTCGLCIRFKDCRIERNENHKVLLKKEQTCKKYEKLEIPKIEIENISSFKSITDEMEDLYEVKNRNYGNSFSQQFQEYGLTSVCIRLEDKLRRLKSLNIQLQDSKNGVINVNIQDESIRDTLIDLANYSVLAIMELDNK